MAKVTEINIHQYLAATQAAAFYPLPEAGLFIVRGNDRITYFQRQTTNDIKLLGAGKSLQTVLTNPAARILDMLTLAAGEDFFYVLPLPGRHATEQYLRSRIFFMDKVTLENVSTGFSQAQLIGPLAAQVLARLAGSTETGGGNFARISWNDAEILVIPQYFGFRLLVPIGVQPAFFDYLAAEGVAQIDQPVYETARIEAGQPGEPQELSEEYTPYELRLEELVSSTKGCYTGQEVLARQVTYDKVTRRLMGIKVEHPIAEIQGATLNVAGKPAGKITSSTVSPRFGALALAVLRRPYDESGTSIHIVAAGQEFNGTVVELPFS